MTDDDSGEARARALARYRRLGPLRSRALSLTKALVCACALIFAVFFSATLTSLNHGTGTRYAGSEEPAVAHVGDCGRRGPISGDGFGFYWKCNITVTAADGRIIRTVIDHSVVTPRDRGRPVEFREVCSTGDTSDCRYGRPTALLWNVTVYMIRMLSFGVYVCLVVPVLVYLVDAVIGTRRYFALVDLFASQSRKGKS